MKPGRAKTTSFDVKESDHGGLNRKFVFYFRLEREGGAAHGRERDCHGGHQGASRA